MILFFLIVTIRNLKRRKSYVKKENIKRESCKDGKHFRKSVHIPINY